MDAVKASLVVVVEVAVDVAVVAPTEAAVVMVKAAVVVDVAADLVATAVLPPGLRMPACVAVGSEPSSVVTSGADSVEISSTGMGA